MKIKPATLIDFYKSGHIFQYPKGTNMIYSNFTARSNAHFLIPNTSKVVFFGLQGVIKWLLIDVFNKDFFQRPLKDVLADYQHRMDNALGPGAVTVDHIKELHQLGYLPLVIKALPEGSLVPFRVPVFTIRNTMPKFFWLTNYFEDMLSAECWKSITNATIAYQYRGLLRSYADVTGDANADAFCDWQGHDFSFRGMSGIYDAAQSGAAHLVSFLGSDTVPAFDYLEEYYDGKKTFLGGSVPATEHSVMCMGGNETELEMFRRLITEVYPSGIVSIVSDTWDFWKVITEYATLLKPEILARKVNALGMAKVVFRPDSGDPVKIICGYKIYVVKEGGIPDVSKLFDQGYEVYQYPQDRYYPVEVTKPMMSKAEAKGAVECLWDIFGGTINEKGYKVLNERVGLIYGDSITYSRASEILSQLEAKGFASSNIVFGIGSYTYQYSTRDSLGFAMKATYGEVNEEARELWKDPITDNGTKKSARGLLRIEEENGTFVLYDQQTWREEALGALQTVFLNGKLVKEQSIAEIRARVGFINM